jgi:hypothetical protein
MYASE